MVLAFIRDFGIFPAMLNASTVLVVEDEEVSRELIQGLLATEGYTVLFAKNGVQALEIATRISPDVVLLDIVMPELDGFEVCRQLRSNPALRQIPIVMLTSLEGRGSRLRGLAAGADEFLTKPVDPIELRTRIRTITGLNRFRQISEERARFEAAVAHSPDGIGLTDREGRLLHANNALVQLVGQVPARIFDCFPNATAEALKTRLSAHQPTIRRVESFETPLALCAVPGASADVTVVRLPGSDGAVFEFILRDITERKQFETQLLRLQRIELLGQVAGGVVHDVNNLLMAVIGNAEVLEKNAAPEARKRAQLIRQAAERGATLLRDILMFARGTDRALKPVHVAAVLHETAGIAAKLFGEKIELDVETPADLPAILGDESQLHQVMMNLCVNASDAMPGGGRMLLKAGAVTLTASEARAIGPDATAGNFLAVSVRDTGTGIPPEIRERLFDPFFTTKPRESATGLGLATVLRVMRRHHGFIGLQTEVGGGTCFTCYIPAMPVAKSVAA
jgi:two-component system cell cycle sensor histidine kinase/response regulator CckA